MTMRGRGEVVYIHLNLQSSCKFLFSIRICILSSHSLLLLLLRSRRSPCLPLPWTGGARCPKVLTSDSQRTATPPPTGPPWSPPPPPSRPPLPRRRRQRRPGARLVLQASQSIHLNMHQTDGLMVTPPMHAGRQVEVRNRDF